MPFTSTGFMFYPPSSPKTRANVATDASDGRSRTAPWRVGPYWVHDTGQNKKRALNMSPSRSTWSALTSTDEAHSRASGRWLYNGVRHAEAMVRRGRVIELLQDGGLVRGAQAVIARELQVHPSTISRDVSRILKTDGTDCPSCEGWMDHKSWDRLREERGLLPRSESA